MTEKAKELDHPRIRLIEGSSTAPEVIAKVKALLPPGEGDSSSSSSDHSEKHVYEQEMKLYSRFVGVGSYMVVEDTNINSHRVLSGVRPRTDGGSRGSFLKEDDHFQDDAAFWKRNYFSFHQNGWLKRVKGTGRSSRRLFPTRHLDVLPRRRSGSASSRFFRDPSGAGRPCRRRTGPCPSALRHSHGMTPSLSHPNGGARNRLVDAGLGLILRQVTGPEVGDWPPQWGCCSPATWPDRRLQLKGQPFKMASIVFG